MPAGKSSSRKNDKKLAAAIAVSMALALKVDRLPQNPIEDESGLDMWKLRGREDQMRSGEVKL